MLSIIQEPADGYTENEKAWTRLELLKIYKMMKTDQDRLIFIAWEEAGMPQEDIGFMLGVTQEAICQKIKNILEYLRNLRKQNLL